MVQRTIKKEITMAAVEIAFELLYGMIAVAVAMIVLNFWRIEIKKGKNK